MFNIRVKCEQWKLISRNTDPSALFLYGKWESDGFKYGYIVSFTNDGQGTIKAVVRHDDGTFKDYLLKNVYEI